MRKLLLSLMVLTSLVSCGKDNSVNGGAAATTNGTTNAVTVNDPNAQNLGNYIDNSNSYFAGVYYQTYRYATASATSAASSCEQKTGWLGIKYYVCSSSSNSSNLSYTTVLASKVDLATKRSELKGYINNSSAGYITQVGTAFHIRTLSGLVYIIDTRFPIQANPVSVQQARWSNHLPISAILVSQ